MVSIKTQANNYTADYLEDKGKGYTIDFTDLSNAYRSGAKWVFEQTVEWMKKNYKTYMWYSEYANENGEYCGIDDDFFDDLETEIMNSYEYR